MIDVVIVNWNAGALLRECLRSIDRYGSGLVSHVIVVDNGSSDGSADGLEAQLGVSVVTIRNTENEGFARACNQGAALGNSPYILFLNPDAQLFEGTLSAAISVFDDPRYGEVGIVGVQLVNEQGRIARSCARFPTFLRLATRALGLDKLPGFKGASIHLIDWDHATTRQVDHVMGAFFLVRRDLFNRLAGFDEQFFVYLEDIDFSMRAYKAGWRSLYLAEAQAFHVGGGTSRQVKAHRLFYSLRSRLLYGFKHFTRWQAWLLMSLTVAVEPCIRTAYCLARGDGAGCLHTWLAYRMLWRGLRKIVHGQGRFRP